MSFFAFLGKDFLIVLSDTRCLMLDAAEEAARIGMRSEFKILSEKGK